VTKDEIWEALRRDDGVQGNAVKVAYMLLRDKHRRGQSLAAYEDKERDATLAVLDPRNNALSPSAVSPTGQITSEENPFEAEFAGDATGDEEDEVDFSPGEPEDDNNFAVLNSSLPGAEQAHHLESFVSARRGGQKEKKQHRTRWHFGIRSRSPPMEVMSAIYASLKALGMEWKEKKDLGGMCASHKRSPERPKISRNRMYDDDVDLKLASAIYFVETRARHNDVVVLMNIQLYFVDGDNYLVDFVHKKTYKASTEPGDGKFDMAKPICPSESGSDTGSVLPQEQQEREEPVVSPYAFMDVACKVILDLAGGQDSGAA